MDNQVRYTVTANDMLSGKLQGMNSSAQALEGTMGGLSKVMSTLGIGFAVFKGLEFVKGGIEKFHELEQVTAKIEANLKSTGEVAGMGLSDIEGYAKGLSSHIQASRADVLDMASQLLTFPAVTKDVFESSMSMVADIAKQTGHGLSETAIMYGKALNSPIDGLSKMQRYGVIFTQQEKDKITALQTSGNLIGAQKEMMNDIAHSGYAGVATAMFNADPLARFNKMMGSLQMSLGEVAMDLLQSLMPSLEAIGKVFKDVGTQILNVVHWFKEHKTITSILTTFIGALVTIMILYNAQQKLSAMYTAFTTTSIIAQTFAMGFMTASIEGASIAGGVLAGVMALINAVNPFVWIVIAIGAVITAVVECYKHFETFRGVLWAVWEVVKTVVGMIGQYFVALKDIIIGAFTMDIGQVEKGLNSMADLVMNSGKKIGSSAKKGYADGVKDFQKEGLADMANKGVATINERVNNGTIKSLEEYKAKVASFTTALDKKVALGLMTKEEEKTTLAGLKGFKKPNVANAGGATTPSTAKNAKGTSGVQANKAVTVNIQIGSLIHDFKISTTNIQESSRAIHDKVVMALTGAVIDSQLIAGQ